MKETLSRFRTKTRAARSWRFSCWRKSPHESTLTARPPQGRAPVECGLFLCPPVKKPIDIALALCYYDIDNTHKEAIFMKKHPFTPEELEEAAAELDEEAAEWVAYCTRCGGAIEVAHDRIRVDAAALVHAIRHKEHQVIVGKEILGRKYGVC